MKTPVTKLHKCDSQVWSFPNYLKLLSSFSFWAVLSGVHPVLSSAHTVLSSAHTVLSGAHTVLSGAHTVLSGVDFKSMKVCTIILFNYHHDANIFYSTMGSTDFRITTIWIIMDPSVKPNELTLWTDHIQKKWSHLFLSRDKIRTLYQIVIGACFSSSYNPVSEEVVIGSTLNRLV